MRNKLLKGLIVGFFASIILGATAYAAYTANIQVINNTATVYTQIGLNASANVSHMAANGFFSGVEGLDTRVLQGTTRQPHMLADDRIMFSTQVNANSSKSLSFTTGSTNLTSFEIIPGFGGNVTTTDSANIEPSDNFTYEITGHIDAGSVGNITSKNGTFTLSGDGAGNISGSLWSFQTPNGFSDPGNDFADENNAFDDNTATFATESTPPAASDWGDYLVLSINATQVAGVRYWHSSSGMNLTNIDLFYGGQWNTIYSNVEHSTGQYHTVANNGTFEVTAMRIRFHHDGGGPGAVQINEVDFLMDSVVTASGVTSAEHNLIVAANSTISDKITFSAADNDNVIIHSVQWAAQSFTTTDSFIMTGFEFSKIFRTGSPGIVFATVRTTDGGGNPTINDIGVSTFNGSAITSVSPGTATAVTLNQSILLAANTQYTVVVRAPNGNAGNSVSWRRISSGGFSGGALNRSTTGGATWDGPETADLLFKVFGNDGIRLIVDGVLQEIEPVYEDVPDLTEQWVHLQDDVMAYATNISINVSGVNQLIYNPNVILPAIDASSANIADRSSGTNNWGRVNWGTNPITVTLSSFVSDFSVASVDALSTQDVVPVITTPQNVVDVTRLACLATDDPLLYPIISAINTASSIPILATYWMIFLLLAIMAFFGIYAVFPNLVVSALAFDLVIGFGVAYPAGCGVFDWWVLALLAILTIGATIFEGRQPA